VTYITPDDPPFLILHGDRDETVAARTVTNPARRIEICWCAVDLVVVKNAGHGFRPVDGDLQPSMRELVQQVVNFFDKYLK